MRYASRKAVFLLTALAAMAMLGAVAASASGPPIVNGSFQTCDLTAWTVVKAPGGTIPATGGVKSGGVDSDGCQGFITTGGGSNSPCDFVNTGSGPYVFTTLTHSNFYATAGTKVLGYAATFGDTGCGGGIVDLGQVVIDGSVVWSGSGSGPAPIGSFGTNFSYTLGYTGYHTLQARVENTLDHFINTTMWLDDVRIDLYKAT